MHIFASRQCADYAHSSYAGADEACVARVTFAVGEAVWCLLQCCHPRPPSPSPENAVIREQLHLSESSVEFHFLQSIKNNGQCLEVLFTQYVV